MDPIVFLSDDEDKFESESDYESIDTDESANSEPRKNANKKIEQDSQTGLKNNKNRQISKSIVKKSLLSKGKTLARKENKSTNKSKCDKDRNNIQKTQVCKTNMIDKRETRNVSNKVCEENDEYEDDSSDEEDIRNTVGKIPMKWYDEYKHIGYDWEGQKILKPEKGDELDNFLKRMEDPDFWRTIKDPQTGHDVVLSQEDIDLIVRVQKQKVPDVQFDEYAVSSY